MNDFELKHPRAGTGEFTTKQQLEPGFKLTSASLASGHSLAVQRLQELELFVGLDQDTIEEAANRVAGSMNFTDENVIAVADEVSMEAFGHTATARRMASEVISELRTAGRHDHATAVAQLLTPSGPGFRPASQELDPPVSCKDPRVMAGEILDKVAAEDGTVFHRRREGVYPNEPTQMRFQASRPLSDEEARHFAGIVGYSYATHIRRTGEGLGEPERDTPYSFIVAADTRESSRSNLAQAMDNFEDDIPEMLLEGSRVRPRKNNTRLIEGFKEPDLTFEIYYDSV